MERNGQEIFDTADAFGLSEPVKRAMWEKAKGGALILDIDEAGKEVMESLFGKGTKYPWLKQDFNFLQHNGFLVRIANGNDIRYYAAINGEHFEIAKEPGSRPARAPLLGSSKRRALA